MIELINEECSVDEVANREGIKDNMDAITLTQVNQELNELWLSIDLCT